jgi:ABC-2 type transport system ATP-binding protein
MMKKMIVRNISKEFKGGFGIKKISFEVNAGDIVGFIGDNGMGKTTTIKSILGELKIQSGDVIIDGEKISQFAQRVAFFPDQRSFPSGIRVCDYLMYYLSLKDIKISQSKIDALFEECGLKGVYKKKIATLSSGMVKKMLFIAVLLTDADLIILDEPTANLDVESRLQMLEILKEFGKRGKAIIITSHIIDELKEIVNRLLIIRNGRIVYDDQFDNKVDDIEEIYHKVYESSRDSSNVKRILSIIE